MRAALKREHRYSWCCVVVWLDIFSIRAAPLLLNDSCSLHKLLQFRCQPQPLCRHPISVSDGCIQLRLPTVSPDNWHLRSPLFPRNLLGSCPIKILAWNQLLRNQTENSTLNTKPLRFLFCLLTCRLTRVHLFFCVKLAEAMLWKPLATWRRHMEKSLYQESPTFFNLIATSRVLSRMKGNGIATLFWSNTFCLVSL